MLRDRYLRVHRVHMRMLCRWGSERRLPGISLTAFSTGRSHEGSVGGPKAPQRPARRKSPLPDLTEMPWEETLAIGHLTLMNVPEHLPTDPAEPADLIAVVAASQAGDREMQRELFERCRDPVYRVTVRMVGRQDASDITQQVFLRIFQNLDGFAGRSGFMTWLYRVTMNECLQWIRRARRRPVQALAFDPSDHRQSPAIALHDKELLESALARIDPDLRCVFLLREVEDLSYARIAEVLQIACGTVASRLSRARQQLQIELRRMGWDG